MMRFPIARPPKIELNQVLRDCPDFFQHIVLPEAEEFLRRASEQYWHWEQLRWRPLPAVLRHEDVWAYVRWTRRANRREVLLRDEKG